MRRLPAAGSRCGSPYVAGVYGQLQILCRYSESLCLWSYNYGCLYNCSAIEEIAAVHPDGKDMYVQVICSGDDYWPLPWYLRGFSRIGWQGSVNDDMLAAAVIIASAELEQAVIKNIYQSGNAGEKKLYVPLFDSVVWLRPQSELLGFVTKELYDGLGQKGQSIQ